VILGAAVATSVLTGALLVGDSVEGSLRQLTLGRLGKVDHAIMSTRYFRASLAQDLASELAGETRVVPLMAVQASIEVAGTGVRAHKVSLYGVDDRFAALFDLSPVAADSSRRLRFFHANGPLRKTLDAQDNESLILSVESHSAIHREFVFGRGEAEDQVIRTRVRMGKQVEDEAGGRFSFEPNQSIPLVAFVRLSALQNLLGLNGQVNRLLISSQTLFEGDVVGALARTVTLEDYGLSLRTTSEAVSLESDQFLLSEAVVDAAHSLADRQNLAATGVFTYLSNALISLSGSVPYSTISAVGSLGSPVLPDQLTMTSGGPLKLPEGEGVYLNKHAAERLKVGSGDSVTLRYFEVESDESFTEAEVRLPVAEVVRPEGLAADRFLTPEFPGLHDADNMADWDAPFPVDFSVIEEADEAYWDDFGATPKAFVSLRKGQSLWSSRFGSLSSVRFHVPADPSSSKLHTEIEGNILSGMSPESQGFRVVPLRSQGLASSKGATDFRGLFFGFSMFLVVSGLAMMSQLFKLGIQDRRAEIGLLKAVGFETSRVRRRLLYEGLLLGALGATIGVGGASLYGRAMIYGLSTWWFDAVGTRLLTFHGSSGSMIGGWLITMLLIAAVVWRGVGAASAEPAIRLMKQVITLETTGEGGKTGLVLALFSILSGVLFACSLFVTAAQQVGLFFALAACALVSLLAATQLLAHRFVDGKRGTIGMACSQIARFPNRTMASLTLIALAVFVLVAVGLNRHESGGDKGIPQGAGGFRWIGETAIPITADLGKRRSLLDAGFTSDELDRLGKIEVHAFRLKPGEDVSCLNLHRPGQPRILGVSQPTIDRGGFTFKSKSDGVDELNPLRGLELDLGEDVIPVIGDFNSVQWILHLGLGQDMVVLNEKGRPVRLRFVALLSGSVLQSEVLMSEKQFTKHFPSIEGYSFFAMETASAHDEFARRMETHLDRFGMDVTTTQFRLAQYRAVENTYMATFQMVGGFGALLGTLGVAVLMMRNAAERRGELAAMRAIGFSRRRLSVLLITETTVIVVLGIGIGTVAGLLAVAPTLVSLYASVPWEDLGISLFAVAVTGMLAGILTTTLALRAPIVETLKAEG
jgi:ABC-type antimicrobial peptide transport system permease subunit